MNNRNKVRFIDLFAGIGGFHLALKRFNTRCVFSSKWDKHAAEVYENNFGIKPHGDITKIEAKEIPVHDILCAGFPCQAFSISGKQKGFNDTRGALFFDICRIVDFHQPKVLLLENVKNLKSHDEGKTLITIEKNLKQLGYDVYHAVLNASDYGLPQNRQRIFFACFKKDLNVHDYSFPKPLEVNCSLNDILENNPLDAKIIKRDDIFYKNEQMLLLNNGTINKPIRLGSVSKGGQGERIYSPDGHSITLSAYGGGVGSKTGLYLVDGEVRKLSPRECARLQGFPEEFKLSNSMSQSYKQFGNSVAVNVLVEIFKGIFSLRIF